MATGVVFLFSAVFHEIVLSTPFRFYAMHAFIGMLIQAPLIHITKKIDKYFENDLLSNGIFWSIFCLVGQPIGLFLYNYDLWKLKQ
jgi:diacylglycerol O-acyltransferase-1